jgi:hypothetical protein
VKRLACALPPAAGACLAAALAFGLGGLTSRPFSGSLTPRFFAHAPGDLMPGGRVQDVLGQ